LSTDFKEEEEKILGGVLMSEFICKECKRCVSEREFYLQGRMCKKCRSKKSKGRFYSLTGHELAEDLLHKSCESVLDRVRGNKKEAYKGVECSWNKPLKMKEDLKKNSVFWEKWIEKSKIYEENGRELKLRPTIDRIESDSTKGGHYIMENLQVLSYGENTFKANAVKCNVIFIKNLRIVKIADYQSIKAVMMELEIPGYNTINIIKNSGVIHNIGNGYSILLQTTNGELKTDDSPLYKAVYTKQKILVDFVTGKEIIIETNQNNYLSYGIWFNK
jgi:hypothetical protein